MTDILIMPDGSRWKPSTSSDTVECVSCGNAVDTPEEIASYQMATALIAVSHGQEAKSEVQLL